MAAGKRKGWSALKATTRTRYLRAGVTQAGYEGGRSLFKARGHRNTPERPGRERAVAVRLGVQEALGNTDWNALDRTEQLKLASLYLQGFMQKARGPRISGKRKASESQVIARMDFISTAREYGVELGKEFWREFKEQYQQTFSAAA